MVDLEKEMEEHSCGNMEDNQNPGGHTSSPGDCSDKHDLLQLRLALTEQFLLKLFAFNYSEHIKAGAVWSCCQKAVDAGSWPLLGEIIGGNSLRNGPISCLQKVSVSVETCQKNEEKTEKNLKAPGPLNLVEEEPEGEGSLENQVPASLPTPPSEEAEFELQSEREDHGGSEESNDGSLSTLAPSSDPGGVCWDESSSTGGGASLVPYDEQSNCSSLEGNGEDQVRENVEGVVIPLPNAEVEENTERGGVEESVQISSAKQIENGVEVEAAAVGTEEGSSQNGVEQEETVVKDNPVAPVQGSCMRNPHVTIIRSASSSTPGFASFSKLRRSSLPPLQGTYIDPVGVLKTQRRAQKEANSPAESPPIPPILNRKRKRKPLLVSTDDMDTNTDPSMTAFYPQCLLATPNSGLQRPFKSHRQSSKRREIIEIDLVDSDDEVSLPPLALPQVPPAQASSSTPNLSDDMPVPPENSITTASQETMSVPSVEEAPPEDNVVENQLQDPSAGPSNQPEPGLGAILLQMESSNMPSPAPVVPQDLQNGGVDCSYGSEEDTEAEPPEKIVLLEDNAVAAANAISHAQRPSLETPPPSSPKAASANATEDVPLRDMVVPARGTQTVKPHRCPHCQSGFESSDLLAQHILEIHDSAGSESEGDPSTFPPVKRSKRKRKRTAKAREFAKNRQRATISDSEGEEPADKLPPLRRNTRQILMCPYCYEPIKKWSRMVHLRSGKCPITPDQLTMEEKSVKRYRQIPKNWREYDKAAADRLKAEKNKVSTPNPPAEACQDSPHPSDDEPLLRKIIKKREAARRPLSLPSTSAILPQNKLFVCLESSDDDHGGHPENSIDTEILSGDDLDETHRILSGARRPSSPETMVLSPGPSRPKKSQKSGRTNCDICGREVSVKHLQNHYQSRNCKRKDSFVLWVDNLTEAELSQDEAEPSGSRIACKFCGKQLLPRSLRPHILKNCDAARKIRENDEFQTEVDTDLEEFSADHPPILSPPIRNSNQPRRNNKDKNSDEEPDAFQPEDHVCPFADCLFEPESSAEWHGHQKRHPPSAGYPCSAPNCDRIFWAEINRTEHSRTHRRVVHHDATGVSVQKNSLLQPVVRLKRID